MKPLVWIMLVLTGLAMAVAACGGVSREPPDFERMRRQQRYDPYEASELFADGMTMRVPPAGTVPYDAEDTPPAVRTGLTGSAPAGEIPIPVTTALVERGRDRYAIYCGLCHGADGSGASVMGSNLPGAPPLSLVTQELIAQPPGQLFSVIANGKDRMPAFDWALTPTDRWAVVAYVRELQQSRATAAASHGQSP